MKQSIASALMATMLAAPAVAHEDHDAKHGARAQRASASAEAGAEQTPFGKAGNPAKVSRVIELTMTDNMRFTPDKLTVTQGETVKLVVANAGKSLHEIVLGTPAGLAEHAELMRKNPDMAHSAPYMVHVPAGTAGEVVWQFNKPGSFDFACLLPGHFEAGMKGSITVVPHKP